MSLQFIEIPDSAFPSMLSKKIKVRCTYPTTSMSVHLMDPGTCAIPRDFTITREEWIAQQIESEEDC